MRLLVAAALLVAGSASALAEDVVVLENGREARGRIVEDSDAGVKLEVGGGKMFYPRSKIREVRRDAAAPEADAGPPPEPVAAADTREEYAVLYQDGRRVGARVLRCSKMAEGFRFEEEVFFLDANGVPEMQVRTTERSDANLLPLSFQTRETAGASEHRMVVGEVRGGRLYETATKAGEKTVRDDALPQSARFPFAAREMFLRESKALGGKFDATIYDPRDRRWRSVSYSECGMKPLDENGKTVTVRVILRRRGDVVEREWIDEKLVARMTELNGESLRALASNVAVVGRLRDGDTERVTGPDSSARTQFIDAEGGWRVGKPDPSWTFEQPAIRGSGALLSVRNTPLFASVDLLRDTAAPADVTIERAAESLQRLCRTVAPDFRVTSDGYKGEGAARVYWLEAAATTKGERTRTLAHVLVRGGKVYRLLAACPESVFEVARPDLEKILASFVVE